MLDQFLFIRSIALVALLCVVVFAVLWWIYATWAKK